MNIIWLILSLVVSGLIVGALGRLVVRGPDPMTVPMTIVLGILGSLIGGFIGRVVFGSDIVALVLSVIAAALLVIVVRNSRGGRLASGGS